MIKEKEETYKDHDDDDFIYLFLNIKIHTFVQKNKHLQKTTLSFFVNT